MDSAHIRSFALKRENFFLFDPEKPLADPNEMLLTAPDPSVILHNCPMCNRTLGYELFVAHLRGPRGCYAKWRKVKLDITHKVFRGGGPNA